MWTFKKKKPIKKDKPEQKNPNMEPPVAIGERFKYLGVEMICRRHFAWPYEPKVVVADYITNHGEIKEVVFSPVDFVVIKTENNRPRNSRYRDNILTPCWYPNWKK